MGWGYNEGIDPFEWGQCIRAWLFIKGLGYEGELAQRQVLLNVGTTYDEMPKEAKRELELLNSEGEDEELIGNGVNE